MSILGSQLNTTGLEDSPTSFIFITTNDTVATITTAGYLSSNLLPTDLNSLSIYQMAAVYTTDQGTALFQVSYANNVWSLSSASAAGEIALPTVANQIVYATNTLGALGASGLATALFNAGNISAGLSGTAGILESYPATATTGKLQLVGVSNAANYTVSVSNTSFGQASTVSFADVGSAAGRFLVANTATPFTDGHVVKASGTGGLTLDSGFLASNVMLLNAVNTMAAASQIILDKGVGTEASNAVTINKQAGTITTTSLTTAGGATETITLTNSEVATTSQVLVSIGNGTNTATNAYSVSTTITGAHTVVFVVTNLTAATALNGTLVINFAVV